MNRQNDDVNFTGVGFSEGFFQMLEVEWIAHGDKNIAGATCSAWGKFVALVQAETVVSRSNVGGERGASGVDSVRRIEKQKERQCEGDAGNRGEFFGEDVDACQGEKQRGDGGEADRNFITADAYVARHLPFAIRCGIRKRRTRTERALKGEIPRHAEGVGFAEIRHRRG